MLKQDVMSKSAEMYHYVSIIFLNKNHGTLGN